MILAATGEQFIFICVDYLYDIYGKPRESGDGKLIDLGGEVLIPLPKFGLARVYYHNYTSQRNLILAI